MSSEGTRFLPLLVGRAKLEPIAIEAAVSKTDLSEAFKSDSGDGAS
jgi:hypothetical protein